MGTPRITIANAVCGFLLASGALMAGCTSSSTHAMNPAAFEVPHPAPAPIAKAGPVKGRRSVATNVALAGPAGPGAKTAADTGDGALGGGRTSIIVPGALSSQFSSVQAAPAIKPGETLRVAALLGSVDGRPLFVQAIFNMVNSDLQREAANSRTMEYFRHQAAATLARAIREKVQTLLLLDAARRKLNSDQKKQVDAFVSMREAKLLAQYMGSEERANRALKLQGTSLNRRLRAMRNKATLELFINHAILPQIVITRRELLRYYRHHLSKYTRHTSVSLYTITYPVIRQWPRNPNDPTHTEPIRHPTAAQIHEARQKALAYCRLLEKKIKTGANFAFLAEDNSVDYAATDGGHTPNVRPEELSHPALAKLIMSLHADQMAPPMLIKAPGDPRRDRVLIVKLGRVVPHQIQSFEEVQKKILEHLTNRDYQRLIRAYYHRLYGKESVRAMVRMAKTATNVAVAKYWNRS